jgi:putative peptidoglycan lipid II flippase
LIIPTLLFDGGIGPLLLARWSNQLVSTDTAVGWRDIARPILKGVLLATMCSVLLVTFAPEVVRLVLRHGHFTESDAVAVAQLLRVLGVGFVASMGAFLLERLYLARVRNRTLALLSLVRAGSRISVILAFLSHLGLVAFGIGYATAEMTYLVALIAWSGARRPATSMSEDQ